jgi:hypothetical protein
MDLQELKDHSNRNVKRRYLDCCSAATVNLATNAVNFATFVLRT